MQKRTTVSTIDSSPHIRLGTYRKVANFPLLTYLLLALLAFLGFSRQCLRDDSLGLECLASATPLIDRMVAAEQVVRGWIQANYVSAGLIFGGAILVFGAASIVTQRRFDGMRLRCLELIAVILCVIGQGCLFGREPALGSGLLAAGCSLLLLSFSLVRVASTKPYPVFPQRFTWTEGLVLLGLTFTILLSRMYALNQVPSGWDDELCFSRIMSVKPTCALRANFGVSGAASSNGSLWVLMHAALARWFGASLLWERLLSTTIGVTAAVTMYFFARSFLGVLGGVLAAGLFAFSPLEAGWGRLPTFHHLPGLFAILIMWCTLTIFRSRTGPAVALLASLIILSAGLYPSGVLLGIAALSVLLMHWIFRFSIWRGHHAKMLVLFGAGIGWFFSDSLLKSALVGEWVWDWPGPGHYGVTSPEMIGGPSTTATSMVLIFKVFAELKSFFVQLYWDPIRLWSHWSPLASLQPASWLSWVSLSFLPLGVVTLVRSSRRAILCLYAAWFVLGLLPGILSQVTDRRIGSVTPLLVLLAALAIIQLLPPLDGLKRPIMARVMRMTVGFFVVAGALFFHTGEFFSEKKGTPFIEGLAREMGADVKLPVLIVPLLSSSHQCQLFYALYERSTANGGLIGWSVPNIEDLNFPTASSELSVSENSIYYQCTNLPAVAAFRPERVLYVGRGETGGAMDAYVRRRWPGVLIEARRVCDRQPECDFWIATVDLVALQPEDVSFR